MISDIRNLAPKTTAAAPRAAATTQTTAASAAVPTDRAELGPRPSLSALRAEVAAEAASLDKKLAAHREGEVIVKVKPDISQASFKSMVSDLGLKIVEKFNVPANMREAIGGDMYLVKSSDLRTSEGIAILRRNPLVAYAASNDELHLIEPTEKKIVEAPPKTLTADPTVPNDLDPRLWGMRNQGQDGGTAGADIHATQAWSVHTGRTDAPIVAVIDTGVDYTHPELAANVWTNPDPNAPDRHGYNFADNTPDPMDDHSHGTHCSGTIAAEGNNGQGVVGVNWHAQVMGVKFLSAQGSGSTADAIRGVMYASEHGARITSNSWGGGGYNQALYDALKASPALHIFAAGNEKNDNDRSPSYPASYNLDNIVAVAASDRNDHKASFSNYGHTTVDLAAPGKDILSTVPHNGYAVYSGTSMATPHVSGVAALISSKFPDLTNEQLKARLLNSVDKVAEWSPLVATGGRLNANNALEEDNIAPLAPCDLSGEANGATRATVRWTATGDDGAEGIASSYDLRWSERPITADGQDGSVTFDSALPVATAAPQASGSPEQASISLPPSGRERTLYVALQVRDNVGNGSPIACTSVTIPAANVAFEGNDAANWNADRPWALVDEPGHGRVWASSDGQQDNNANVSLTTRAIDLSTMKGATLNYTSARDLESGYDFLHVEVSDNGGKSWTEIANTTGQADWATESADLSAYDGKQVAVRFRVTTDGSMNSVGVKLADVVVAGDRA